MNTTDRFAFGDNWQDGLTFLDACSFDYDPASPAATQAGGIGCNEFVSVRASS